MMGIGNKILFTFFTIFTIACLALSIGIVVTGIKNRELVHTINCTVIASEIGACDKPPGAATCIRTYYQALICGYNATTMDAKFTNNAKTIGSIDTCYELNCALYHENIGYTSLRSGIRTLLGLGISLTIISCIAIIPLLVIAYKQCNKYSKEEQKRLLSQTYNTHN